MAAKVSSIIASAVGALVGEDRRTPPTQGTGVHASNSNNNNSEPSVLQSSTRIHHRAAAGCEEQNKRTPGEREPTPRAAEEAGPCPQSPSVRGSEMNKEGATTVYRSRAEEIRNTTTHAAGDATTTAGGAAELGLRYRPRMMSMSELEGNSERVRRRTTACLLYVYREKSDGELFYLSCNGTTTRCFR